MLYIEYYCGRGWLLAEEQRGIHGQNIINVIMTVPGLGRARVNYNAECCMYGLNQKIAT